MSEFFHEVEMQIISIGKMFPVDPKGEGFIVMFRGLLLTVLAFLVICQMPRLKPFSLAICDMGCLSIAMYLCFSLTLRPLAILT